jgi:coenzyme F420-reducing hydrogenase delta subunit
MKNKTVIFFCNWSSYPGLQMSSCGPCAADSDDTKFMVSMCSGRISPELIVQSFQKGAAGVMLAACPKDKCEHDGNYQTVGRVRLLKTMLGQLGINPERLRLEWIDKGEAGKLQQAIDRFTSEIQSMEPG